MKKWSAKRRLAIILSILMVAAFPAGCLANANGDGPVPGEYVGFDGVDTNLEAEITIYRHYADGDKANVDLAIEKMNKKYPNLVINIEHRADGDGTALKTWAAVGELPDIFENTAVDAYQSMLDNGDIYPLDDAVAATGFYDLFTNGKTSQEGHTNADGHQYSLACEADYVLCLWYNREVFEELSISEPTNYEEFKASITALKDAGKIPIALFGSEQWPAVAMYALATVAEGQYEGLDSLNDGTATMEDAAFKSAADKFQEIVDLGAFGTGALSTNYQQATEMLSTGMAGYMTNGSWFWVTTETDGFADTIDWCNYNVFADADVAEEVKGRMVGGQVREQYHSVNANPPSGLDPYLLSLLLCEFEYNFQLSNAESGNLSTVIGDFEFKGGEAYVDFKDNYSSFKSFTYLPGDMDNAELITYVNNAVEMMVTGNYTAEEFVQEMQERGF